MDFSFSEISVNRSKSISLFPKDWLVSNPCIPDRHFPKAAFHWQISEDDRLHDICNSRNPQNTLHVVAYYENYQNASNTNVLLFQQHHLEY